MPGPYDYTVNIPQPPAQNFLQSLLGIQQLKGLQQQSQLAEQQAAIQQQQAQFAQERQPLELQHLQEQINFQKAQQAGQAVITAGNQLTLDQRKKVESAIDAFNKDPENGIMELAKVAPYMDANAREGIAKGVQFQVGRQVNDALNSGNEITPADYQKWSNALTLLPSSEQNQARNAILSMPQNLQTFTKSGVVGITNAALNGNREAAIAASDEAAQALNNSNHPAAQATARLFDKLTNQLKDESVDLRRIPISALNVAGMLGDKDFNTTLLNVLKENAVMQKGEVEKNLPGPILKDNLAIQKKVDAADEMASKLSQAANSIRHLEPTSDIGSWWTEIKQRLGLTQPEIAIRNNASQLAGLGMLGQESSAMGGAIRSNVQFQYATGKLPSAWNSPQDLAKRLDIQAEVQQRISKLMAIDSEWNSAFIGKPKATKSQTIMGIEVAPGTSISDFKKTAAELLFPKDEQLPVGVSQTSKAEPATRKKTGIPPAANNIFKTNIGGKSITVERE